MTGVMLRSRVFSIRIAKDIYQLVDFRIIILIFRFADCDLSHVIP